MPFVSSFGTVAVFNGLFDGWDTTVFQFNKSYKAEFPLVAANGYYFADNLEVYVDGKKAERGGSIVSIVMGALNSLIGYQAYTAQFTWEMPKAKVLSVPQVTKDFANGTSLAEIGKQLAADIKTVNVTFEEVAEISFDEITEGDDDFNVTWNTVAVSSGSYDPSSKGMQSFHMQGYLDHSVSTKYDAKGFTDNSGQIPVTAVITVNAAGVLNAPDAEPKPVPPLP